MSVMKSICKSLPGTWIWWKWHAQSIACIMWRFDSAAANSARNALSYLWVHYWPLTILKCKICCFQGTKGTGFGIVVGQAGHCTVECCVLECPPFIGLSLVKSSSVIHICNWIVDYDWLLFAAKGHFHGLPPYLVVGLHNSQSYRSLPRLPAALPLSSQRHSQSHIFPMVNLLDSSCLLAVQW